MPINNIEFIDMKSQPPAQPATARPPIQTAHLFALLDFHLLNCLRSCTNEDWQRNTLAGRWTIKDVAAHLLDGNLRMLSMSRDAYFGETAPEIKEYKDLVNYLNQLNADWIKSCKRISPAALTSLLEFTGHEYAKHIASLDPWAEAVFPVAWAGETSSLNWFHIAREYTEKWHHQQQIREALGSTATLMERQLFHPFIATMLKALPHHYRNVQARPGSSLLVEITGEAGGKWTLYRQTEKWELENTAVEKPTAGFVLGPEIAWKLFTKGMTAAQAEIQSTLYGDIRLAKPMLTMLSVMA